MTVKHLLNGVAIVAALAIGGPVWAQNNQSSGNGMGTPRANPHAGSNLPPDSGGGYPTTAPAPTASSTAPSAYHAAGGAKAMPARHKYRARRALTADTTAQLNRQELVRIQSEIQTAEQKQINQLGKDQEKKQEQFRNMYNMIRASSYKP